MNYNNVLTQMASVTPPCQPELHMHSDSSPMLLCTDWNRKSPKGKALFYQFTTGETDGDSFGIIPDGCVHFFFKCDPLRPKALFSGVATKPYSINIEHGQTYFGIIPYSMLGTRLGGGLCSGIADSIVSVDEIFDEPDLLIESVTGADSFERRVSSFIDYAQKYVIDPDYKPDFLDYMAILLCINGGNMRSDALEQELGYSKRYCRERFSTAYGISPKKYSAIIRFQNAVKRLGDPDCELSVLANDVGYFDQSHFSHSFKNYTGTSPEALRKAIIR